MKQFNQWHPYPRYGLAVAAVMTGQLQADFTDLEVLREMAIQSLEMGLSQFMLRPAGSLPGKADRIYYGYVEPEKLDPGRKSGQSAKNGYYTAPHVLTGNDAKELLKAVKRLLDELKQRNKALSRPHALKRSFAPMVSKLNNGRASMQDPKVGLLMAAFTAIATLTPLKAAAYTRLRATDSGSANTGIIPDLPFFLPQQGLFPLIDYLRLFRQMCDEREGEDPMLGRVKNKTYERPPIFQGNYPNAVRNRAIGAVSLLVAIGEWVKKGRLLGADSRAEFARQVLEQLYRRPLYLVSYSGVRQEHFGHHLVDITLHGESRTIVQALYKTRLPRTTDKGKAANKDKRKQHFELMADRFLRLFTPATFRDFLAFRAEYDFHLFPLLIRYMMKEHPHLTPQLIASAKAYGVSLNKAAYIAAKEEVEGDKSSTNRSLAEYKDKYLSQFESTIHSARSGTALLSQLSTIAGRITKREIDPEALPFMEAVALGQQAGGIGLKTAQELITAFMRVRAYSASSGQGASSTQSPAGQPLQQTSTAFDAMPED
ncbi:MAG: hypothetical protein D6730_20760 [Bacteroidetes bacterium]|nr:MAG: hypothetical protein D6730_20760 [Bacteroidota bacterium]